MPELKFLYITNKGLAFDPQTGDSFQLNESAGMILELMQENTDQDEIIKKIVSEYDISYEKALTDILEFKIQLKILGLVT